MEKWKQNRVTVDEIYGMYKLVAVGALRTHWFGICEGIVVLQAARSRLSYLRHRWILRKEQKSRSPQRHEDESSSNTKNSSGNVSCERKKPPLFCQQTANNPLYSKRSRPVIPPWQRRDDSNNFHGMTSINNRVSEFKEVGDAGGGDRNIKESLCVFPARSAQRRQNHSQMLLGSFLISQDEQL